MLPTGLLLSQLQGVDPWDLLDADDPWLRAWAERALERDADADLTDAVLERAARASPLPSRRDAVRLEVVGQIHRVEGGDAEGWSRGLVVRLRIAWDALLFGPFAERGDLPPEERLRQRRCLRLGGARASGVAELARRVRLEVLGCPGGRS